MATARLARRRNFLKNRHGVWIVRTKVPERLEGPAACALKNGKERPRYLQSTGTKDRAEAKCIAVDGMAGFQETLRQAEALVVERPLRTALSQA
jgi:hypothetical protein